MKTSRKWQFFNLNILIFFLAFTTVPIDRAKIDPRARLEQRAEFLKATFNNNRANF
ncbi:MAG: hypothetical protein QNJ38_10370 [Prochloraceae cyanobacterium]|nr:hypothetical protein [Prochloraceae cyanobacterium]